MKPKHSDMFRENAQNCADKAESAKDEPTYKRFSAWKRRGLRLQKSRIGWTVKCVQHRGGLRDRMCAAKA